MARPIAQVEQDLTKLRAASTQLGAELTTAYRSYFASLGPALKQQSIQGCYYLCTSGYPEAFLKLSYDRRTQLLRTLQRTINNAIVDLVVQIEPISSTGNRDDEPTGELIPNPTMPMNWFATPESLASWQKHFEEEIEHSLKEISYKANLLLQQGQVIPQNMPKPILEANPQVDRQGANMINVPNLLSVLVEQDGAAAEPPTDRSEDESRKILSIHSLYLRLTEVEFSDATVLACRKNITQLANKVNVLRREYRQKEQELTIAEAEAAWRNSWFED